MKPCHVPKAILNHSDNDSKSEYYRDQEGFDEQESTADMNVWNSVIHASLKRKLQGLVAENPVASGVSGLIHAAPGYGTPDENEQAENADEGLQTLQPGEVVDRLLSSFTQDALMGATTFIKLASHSNHVKKTTPQTLVLFIGDTDSYRILLHITSFTQEPPRFEQAGEKCVVRAVVTSVQGQGASFDFQLSYDGTQWLIDEAFRL